MISHNIKTPLTSISRAVGNILQLTYGQLVKSLFANGEQGFYYDPNDLSTMYQDAAGTIPVTGVGQPVGLMLDKSKGLTLGSEAIVGGNFENGLIGTVTDGSGSVSEWKLNTVSPISGTQDGKLTVSTPASTRPFLSFPSPSRRVGAVYEFSFDYKVLNGNPAILIIYSGGGGTYTINKALIGSGRLVFKYIATGTGANEILYFSASSPYALQIDNVSVKEIQGNHAYQTTSSMRPLLVASPQRLDFDTVDDKLTTNLPAQLTGCTVVRAVPNVGAQILTGQTIPATYEDNKDHCGLIVINRALTATETSQITKLFNKAAGV